LYLYVLYVFVSASVKYFLITEQNIFLTEL